MATSYTDAELLKLDPQLEALFKKRGIPQVPPPTRKTIKIVRKGFAAAIARFNSSPFAQNALPSEPNWTETDHAVPVNNSRTVDVRVYTPSKPDPQGKGYPVLFFAPAGGWCLGGLETEAFLCRLFCSRLGMLVVNVAYGLYPEVVFEVPQQDCLDVGKWVAANALALGGDLSRGFVWGGNSGGCTWMAVAAHRWQEEVEAGLRLPPITGTFFLCPIFTDEYVDEEGRLTAKYDRAKENRSVEQCRDAPLMNRQVSKGIEGIIGEIMIDCFALVLTAMDRLDHVRFQLEAAFAIEIPKSRGCRRLICGGQWY